MYDEIAPDEELEDDSEDEDEEGANPDVGDGEDLGLEDGEEMWQDEYDALGFSAL